MKRLSRPMRVSAHGGAVREPTRGLATRAAMLLLAASVGFFSGCILYVDDDDPIDPCVDVTCGENAYCTIDGDCACLEYFDGDPNVACDPVMRWYVTDACDDGLPIRIRLFAQDRDWSWPALPDYYETTGLQEIDFIDITCVPGESICYGAQAGDREWGVGLDGADTCDECCFECDAVDVDIGLLTCE
jgi:hypothetical protein